MHWFIPCNICNKCDYICNICNKCDLITRNIYDIQVRIIQVIHQMEIIQSAQKRIKKQTPSLLFTSTPAATFQGKPLDCFYF